MEDDARGGELLRREHELLMSCRQLCDQRGRELGKMRDLLNAMEDAARQALTAWESEDALGTAANLARLGNLLRHGVA